MAKAGTVGEGFTAMGAWVHSMLARYAAGLEQRSAAIPRALNRHIRSAAWAWALVFGLASLLRVLFPVTPVHGAWDAAQIIVPYLLVAAAPMAGFMLAAASFPRGIKTAQPDIRLALYGRWRSLSLLEAKAHPAFGPVGFMASLLVGMLLNVVIRSFEYLLAVPAMNAHAPEWGTALFHLMTMDVVVMNFFYMVCFVMALRAVPYFPRMLLIAWGVDVCMQLIIARQLGALPDLPAAVAAPLHTLLEGNITKVMISVAVWLPYLILSERVNVTYRMRASA